MRLSLRPIILSAFQLRDDQTDPLSTLNDVELSTIEMWGFAAHREEMLSDHEDILLSKIQAMRSRLKFDE